MFCALDLPHCYKRCLYMVQMWLLLKLLITKSTGHGRCDKYSHLCLVGRCWHLSAFEYIGTPCIFLIRSLSSCCYLTFVECISIECVSLGKCLTAEHLLLSLKVTVSIQFCILSIMYSVTLWKCYIAFC